MTAWFRKECANCERRFLGSAFGRLIHFFDTLIFCDGFGVRVCCDWLGAVLLLCKSALLSCVSGVWASDGKSVLRDIRMSGAGSKKHGLSGSRKSFYATDCAYFLMLFLRMVRG